MKNVVVTIDQLSGGESAKQYSQLATNIRCLITPASTEIVAIYENAPLGNSFQFMIKDNSINDIPAQSKITITNAQNTEFNNNDTFITLGNCEKKKLGSRLCLTGVCRKT